MASLMDSPITLKDKLSQVKHLLKDANDRLQEEASKYGIFATKTSAAGQQPIAANLGKQCNGSRLQDVPMDLKRTINDISTIQSVLHCPVFNQIVNVTDSLSKLSHHVDLRPSIGPSDINFNANGELILKPPLEPASFANSVESRLNEYSDNLRNSPQTIDQEYNIRSNGSLNGFNGFDVEQNLYNEQQHQIRMKQTVGSYQIGDPNMVVGQADNGVRVTNIMDQSFDNGNRLNTYMTTNNVPSPHQDYDTEKLVMNTNKNQLASGNNIRKSESKVAQVAAVFEANATPNEGRRLYKANGHQALNKMVPSVAENFATTNNTNDQVDQYRNLQGISYTNEMYKTTQELGCTVESSGKLSNNVSNEQSYAVNSERDEFPHNGARSDVIDGGNNIKKLQIFQNTTSIRPNGASPSTSDGSTVKLADECDSGTSSFSSQPIKGALYSPNSQRSVRDLEDDGLVDSSIDQELIEKLSPEMERVKVTLEKDQNGLGITIAGYALQRDEISGIFIKSITPGSPADRSGKIKILDQIFAVNGLEIINFSNPQAVHVMREQKGRVVTLELMRYLAESKKKKLQTLLDKAVPSSTMDEHAASNANNNSNDLVGTRLTTATVLEQYNGGHETKSPFHNGQGASDQPESIYKNTSIIKKAKDDVPPSPHLVEGSYSNGLDIPENFSQSQMPIAAQRGAVTSSKIIETKQGARNTIEIRSPMCQTTATATYVNKLPDHIDYNTPAKQMAPIRLQQQQQQQPQHHQLQHEASEDLSFGQLMKAGEPEWEKDVKILELYKEPSQSLGFTVKEYANPKDRTQSIIMITSLSPGGIAELDGRLSFGDLLKFVDDTNLEGASLAETVKALKRTCGQVRLGVLKLKRS